jgi:hypothetical protein
MRSGIAGDNPADAIHRVRQMEKNTVETIRQIQFLEKFAASRKQSWAKLRQSDVALLAQI